VAGALDRCARFFVDDEWPHERVEDPPIVRSRYSGHNADYDCWFQERRAEEQLLFYCRAPLEAPEKRRRAVAELFARINYGMVICCFELDLSDGEMRARAAIDYEFIELNHGFLRNLSYAVVVTMDRYLPAILRVIHAEMDPEEALADIEGPTSS